MSMKRFLPFVILLLLCSPLLLIGTNAQTAVSNQNMSSDRPAGVPSGLETAWSKSYMAVNALQVTQVIFMNNETGLEIAAIASQVEISTVSNNA